LIHTSTRRRGDRGSAQRFDVAAFADIGLNRQDAGGPALFRVARDLLQLGKATCGEHESMTVRAEAPGDLGADSGAGTRDDDCLWVGHWLV